MTGSEPIEFVVAVLLVIGAFFTLVAGYGLIKIKDPMSRLHAPTKAGTLGAGSMLAASMIYAFHYAEGSVNELLILAFLFLTAPVSANFISKVHIHRGRTGKPLPKPSEDSEWATTVEAEKSE